MSGRPMCRLCLGRIGRVLLVVQRVCVMLGRHFGLRLFSDGIHDRNPVKALATAVLSVCDGIDPAGSRFGAEGSLADVFRQHLEINIDARAGVGSPLISMTALTPIWMTALTPSTKARARAEPGTQRKTTKQTKKTQARRERKETPPKGIKPARKSPQGEATQKAKLQ